jgi:CheY-like chemotaxis protein
MRSARRVSAPAERAAMAPGVRPRVLVIEDDPSVRVSVCDMLETLGYDPDDVEGGRQGVALLERHRYDLVITDLRMPSMSGWAVVNAVRERLPTMPIIMISGFATDDDARQAQAVGVPLLPKPFTMTELRRVLREMLGR